MNQTLSIVKIYLTAWDSALCEGQQVILDISQVFYIEGDNDIVSFSRGEVIGGSGGGGSLVLSMVGLRWQPVWNVSDRWDVGKLECWSVVGKQLISAVYKIEVDELDS